MTVLANAVMSAYWLAILAIVTAVSVAEVRRQCAQRAVRDREWRQSRIAELERELGIG